MPVMDGLTATRQLRKLHHSLPIIALSADNTASARNACLDAGMDDFLTKPLQQAALGALLRRFVALVG